MKYIKTILFSFIFFFVIANYENALEKGLIIFPPVVDEEINNYFNPEKTIDISWEPSKNTSFYRLLFFNGPKVVLESTTNENKYQVTLPTGKYRWVVFPVYDNGEVSSVATVDSTLDLK